MKVDRRRLHSTVQDGEACFGVGDGRPLVELCTWCIVVL